MAVEVLYNPLITINGVDLSSRAKRAKVSFGQEAKEVTAFGHTARNYIAGLGTPSAEVEFYLDRASGSVVQTIRPLIVLSTAAIHTITLRKSNSAASTSNEIYSMSVIIDGGFDTISGTVGDVETTPVKFACASSAGWTVATTS